MKLVTLSVLILFSQISIAGNTYICKQGNLKRTISVKYPYGGAVPCEVHYNKSNDSKVLWNAKNVIGYCEKKAAEFAKKQKGFGWFCEKSK